MDKAIGCQVEFSKSDKTPPVIVRFCEIFELLLSAGSKIEDVEWHCQRFPKTCEVLEQNGLIDYAQRCAGVPSLKRFCKLAIRKRVKKPLPINVVKTPLPCIVQRYVLLEQID